MFLIQHDTSGTSSVKDSREYISKVKFVTYISGAGKYF